MELIYSLFVLVVLTNIRVECFKCKMSATGVTSSALSVDCSDTTFGDHLNKCVATIMVNGTDVLKSSGCLPKQAGISGCGMSVAVGGISTKICCCDTENCNDENFVNACHSGSGTGGSSKNDKFQCIMKGSISGHMASVSGKMTCSDKTFGDFLDKCGVFVGKVNSSAVYAHMCLPKEQGTSICGAETTLDGAKMKVCCCDSSNCNDDAFAQKCSSATNALLGIAVLVFSLFASAILRV